MPKYELYQTANPAILHAFTHAKLTPIQCYILGRYLDGLKHREIAFECEVSRQFVTKQIKLSIRKLKALHPAFREKQGNHFKILSLFKSA